MAENSQRIIPSWVIGLTLAVAAGLAIWRLADVLLLAFGSIVVAVGLRAIARSMNRLTGVSRRLAVAVTVASLVLGIASGVYFLGALVVQQAWQLSESLPATLRALLTQVGLDPATVFAAAWAEVDTVVGPGLSGIAALGAAAVRFAASFGLALMVGAYLAVSPHDYRRMLIGAAPPRHRALLDRFLVLAREALESWLGAQVLSMLIVGALTTLSLWLLGVPSFLALGIANGLAEFVPVLGTPLGAIPALLTALAEGGTLVVWTALALIAIQQAEGNIILPLLMQRMTAIPPAILLLAVLTFGTLFGFSGVVLAGPLTVVVATALRIWREEAEKTNR